MSRESRACRRLQVASNHVDKLRKETEGNSRRDDAINFGASGRRGRSAGVGKVRHATALHQVIEELLNSVHFAYVESMIFEGRGVKGLGRMKRVV